MFRVDEDRAPTHSQFAMRVAVLGGVALVAFAAIFFRLWFLEVLSGEAYLKEANANRVRELKEQAPRGEMLDRHGKVLVDNRTTLSLQVRPDELPQNNEARNHELKRLGEVADLHFAKIKREIKEQTALVPASPVTLEQKVNKDLVFALRERQDRFPGVSAEQIYVRDYPQGTLGAHLFGFVSEIGPEQLKESTYDGLDPGDRIGATGLEAQYDNVLRGRNGATRVQVDAAGEPRGPELSHENPVAGDNLKLTLDTKVQQAGEQALITHGGGNPGAFVVMKVSDGSILGMGSYPTFDPSIYTPPVSSRKTDALRDDESKPLLDRAIQSSYPTGSTFKLITATAALEEGITTATEPYNDTGSMMIGDQERTNAGGASYGIVDMTSALKVSSDVYFYNLGIRMENAYENGNKDDGPEMLQDWASRFGFGNLTGIDLPSEGPGLVPTPEWRDKLYQDAADPDSCGGTERLFEPGCYETDRPWSVGDNVSLAVGQGDLGATPLQLAVAYAAMANGGDVVRPHLAMEAEDPDGAVTQTFTPAPSRHIDISASTRSTIMEGLREAANEEGGTSASVFSGFPIEIAGKTGTAEKTNAPDQAWYAAIAPFDHPKYVVIVTIENGGFGVETAAPAARDILSVLFDVHASDIEDTGVAGTTGPG
jgi:penicillin-binding protein 2